MEIAHRRQMLIPILALSALALGTSRAARAGDRDDQDRIHSHRQVIVPDEDRFTPFAITIKPGDIVEWVNQDTDDHTVVSDDVYNTAGHRGVDQLLPGTDSNHGQFGTFSLRFNHEGTFVFFCRFHSHLDKDNQPAAPGPRGGIQDPDGNFGTPMMGVVTVQKRGDDD